MSNSNKLNVRDVNNFLYCLIGFDHFLNNLDKYHLSLSDVIQKPASFERLIRCFAHSRKAVKSRKYYLDVISDEDDVFEISRILLMLKTKKNGQT